MHARPPAPCWHGGSGGTGDTGKLPQLLGKGNSQTSHVPGAGDRGLLCLGQLPVVGKEIWGAAGGGWRQVRTGARSCLCDAAWKQGRLLGGSGLLPKVVQPSEKWDPPPFLPSPLQGEEPLLLPEMMLLPLLHTHARGRGDVSTALLGESFSLLPQFFFQETNPSWNSFGSIPSLQHEEHTQGKQG